MTREQLEAVIRRQLSHVAAELFVGPALTESMNHATVAILKAADEYGLAEFGIRAERRRLALAEAVGDASYGGIAGGS